ncbi:MAG: hypothetical protein M0C28_27585 [Candidatus Moduliflexus flocculans]|nr:hypothetical protein [Candidatus Moduliflexus flocculans]
MLNASPIRTLKRITRTTSLSPSRFRNGSVGLITYLACGDRAPGQRSASRSSEARRASSSTTSGQPMRIPAVSSRRSRDSGKGHKEGDRAVRRLDPGGPPLPHPPGIDALVATSDFVPGAGLAENRTAPTRRYP